VNVVLNAHRCADVRQRRQRFRWPAVVLLLLSTASSSALCQEWTLDWYSIDGGGALESESADQEWRLSGTIGQSDGSSPPALTGTGLRLSSGFWSLLANTRDTLFRDRFESTASPGLSSLIDCTWEIRDRRQMSGTGAKDSESVPSLDGCSL